MGLRRIAPGLEADYRQKLNGSMLPVVQEQTFIPGETLSMENEPTSVTDSALTNGMIPAIMTALRAGLLSEAIRMAPAGSVHWTWRVMFTSGSATGGQKVIIEPLRLKIPPGLKPERFVFRGVVRGSIGATG
jgi:hypothetical protein